MPEVKNQRSGEYLFVEPDHQDDSRSYTFYDDEETVAGWRGYYEDWGRRVAECPAEAEDEAQRRWRQSYEEGRPTETRTRLICQSVW